MSTSPPALRGVKETALYVDDLARAKSFYRDVLGLRALVEDVRLCAFDVNGSHILLLFLRGGSLTASTLPGGVIPPHDGQGPLHVGFAIEAGEWEAWENRLTQSAVAIVSRVTWPLGGQSLYFRDPDGHLLELMTPGVWATY
jgi:catechol 2,3-dioxygenase-like lactoylglutathione lyase family enzyme